MMSQLPYAGMALLADADGQVVYRKLPRGLDVLVDLVSAQLRRLLGSLPPGALRSEQGPVLRAIDALQAEGEHADVYSFTARLLLDGTGKPVGAVAWPTTATPASASM